MSPEWGFWESYTGVGIGKEPEVDAIIGPEDTSFEIRSSPERLGKTTSFLYTRETQMTLGERPERFKATTIASTGRAGALVQAADFCPVH